MVTIDTNDHLVTLINVFSVEPIHQDQLVGTSKNSQGIYSAMIIW
jgi:hypothetical protein